MAGRPVVLWDSPLGHNLRPGRKGGFWFRAPNRPARSCDTGCKRPRRIGKRGSGAHPCVRRLNLPILDTLGSSETVHIAASKASPDFALFFYGGCDETFDEESSRRIFRSLRLDEEDKEFIILPGVDHSFRTKDGVPSLEPLDRMLEVTTATLGRYRTTGGCPARPEE